MARDPATARWAMLSAVRVAGALAATLGVILVARAEGWPPRILGVAIVLAALAMTGSVTGHLARRWRSPQP
jgi:drug/metabolite transporter (DMT)-like permease